MISSSTQRKAMSLIGLVLASGIFAGLFFFIDSYSLSVWDYETEVGPATMVITGSEVVEYIDEIRALPTVTRASYLRISTAQIVAYPAHHNDTLFQASATSDNRSSPRTLAPVPEDELNLTVRATQLEDDFVERFPSINNITDGRLPEGPTEIALSWWVAQRFEVVPGDIVMYEHGLNSYYTELELVGIYAQEEIDTRNSNYYTIADVIVPSNLMTEEGREAYSFLDTDRSGFSPFNPDGAISALSAIEESIRELDPLYSAGEHSFFYIDDILAKGILRYSEWVDSTKASQLIRTQGFSLFAIIWMGLSVRFNVKKRKQLDDWLEARGASSRQIMFARIKEIISVSFLSVLLALPIGFAISRIGFATGHTQNGATLQYTHQFFISFDSAITLMILGLSGPLILFGFIQGLEKAQKAVISGSSRLERLSSAVKVLRWDATVVLVSFATLIALWQIGGSLAGTPLLLILLYGAPLALILGLTSLLSKGISSTSRVLSRLSESLPVEIGVRRIGRDATSAGATILVITLAISLVWNVSVIDATLPNTNLSHARFAIGADVTFRLNQDRRSLWPNLTDTISSKSQVEALTEVTVFGLSLSAELQDTVEFVVVNPLEYAIVGYDSTGTPIENSHLMPFLQDLEEIPNGAVMTSGVANRLDLTEGDALRAFRQNGSSVETMTFNVVGVTNSLPDSMIGPNGYTPPLPSSNSASVGKGRIWITREFATEILDIEDAIMDLVCIRLKTGSDGESFINEILESGQQTVLNGYASATSIVNEMTQIESLRIGRAIDSFLLFFALGALPASYMMYTVDLLKKDSEESVLLRSMGMAKRTLQLSVIAEMFGIIVYSLILLTLFSPVQVNNSMNIIIISSELALRAFPVPMIPIIPFTPLLMLLIFTVSSAFFVGLIASRKILDDKLIAMVQETWVENFPFRRG